ncbi:hypothetical protein L0F63_000958 [Massospora cicadina]|nr:hypothetical protein L0F63_000958 [Massospora cicadina]
MLGRAFSISGQKVPQQLLAEPAAEPAQDAVSLPFRVDNKYYTADLDLWVDAAPDAPGTEVVAAYEPVARAIDALVFVFTDPSSFSEISPWADFVRRWEPAVALCVRAPSATPVAEQVIDAFGWCVDNGFEYIDLTTDDPESGDVSRIYEALQGNPWQGLSRKGSVPAGPQPAGDLLPDHDAGTEITT